MIAAAMTSHFSAMTNREGRPGRVVLDTRCLGWRMRSGTTTALVADSLSAGLTRSVWDMVSALPVQALPYGVQRHDDDGDQHEEGDRLGGRGADVERLQRSAVDRVAAHGRVEAGAAAGHDEHEVEHL